MSKNINSLPPIHNSKEVGKDDIFYMVTKPVGSVPVDTKISAGVLMEYILGVEVTSNLTPTDIITIRDTATRNPSTLSIDSLDKYIVGETKFNDVDNELCFRVFMGDKVGGTQRGSIKFSNIVKSLTVKDKDVITIEDPSKTSIRLDIDGTPSKINFNLFEQYVFGKDLDTGIKLTDIIYKKSGDGKERTNVTFETTLKSIFTPNAILKTDLKDSTKIFVVGDDVSKRGVLNLKDFTEYITDSLKLPVYSGSDSVSDNVTFPYKDVTTNGTVYGYITKNALKGKIVINDTIIIGDDTVIRANSGNKDGIISYSNIKKDLIASVINIYGIDPAVKENKINDGDGLIFVRTGDAGSPPTYKNISFVTLRDQIINGSSSIHSNIISTTKIIVDGGYITYGDLFTKISKDLKGI